ncbi:hypothetical protein [Amnibacterium sp.]|uniref:hypothetical protein n=1 Tax=Amnibacterium sp. TaxID=1872496 RepID=UPI003F7BD676
MAGVAAAAAAAVGLDRPGLGYDESASRWAAGLPVPELFHLLGNIDAVHGLYYLLLHAWAALGSDPTWLRVPSALASVAAAVCVAALTAGLTGSAVAAAVAGVLLAASTSVVYYAQTARSYAVVLCAVCLGTLLLAGLVAGGEPGRRRGARWVGYALCMLAAAWLNELSVLALVAHGTTVLLLKPGRRRIAAWAAVAVVVAVLVLPLVLVSRTEAAAIAFLRRPGFADAITLARADLGADAGTMGLVLVLAVVGAVVPRRAATRPRAVAAVALPLVLLPPAILAIASRLGPQSYYSERYVLYTVAGVAVLAGAGAGAVARVLAGATRRRWVEAVLAVAVCVALPATQLGAELRVRSPQARQFDFGPPTALVAAQKRPGDVVLFAGRFFRMAALGYPERFAGVRDVAIAVPPAAAGSFTGIESSWPAVAERVLAARRVWVVGALPVDPDAARRIGQEARLLTERYRLVRAERAKGVTASLWERAG